MNTPLTDEQIDAEFFRQYQGGASKGDKHIFRAGARFARALLAQPAAQPAPGGGVQNLARTGCAAGTEDECMRRDCATACPALQSTQAQGQDAAPAEQPPFGTKRAAALALYKPPFKFRMGYIHDAGGHMVADQDGFGEGSKVFDSIAARVRGWGRIGYMPDAEALQDEVGAVLADALTAYWNSAARAKE